MTVWGLLIGDFVANIGIYGTNQTTIQRYCALPTLRKARL